jgi:hypothetical protein
LAAAAPRVSATPPAGPKPLPRPERRRYGVAAGVCALAALATAAGLTTDQPHRPCPTPAQGQMAVGLEARRCLGLAEIVAESIELKPAPTEGDAPA